MIRDRIQLILSDPYHERVPHVLNELLNEFWQGRPLADLERLLADPASEWCGLCVLSSIGSRALPMLPAIARGLRSLDWQARSFAVSAVLTSETDDVAVVAEAMSKLVDSVESVRNETAKLVVLLSDETLRAAIGMLQAWPPHADANHADLLGALHVLIAPQIGVSAVDALANDESSIVRRCALLACIRRGASREHVTHLANASNDEELVRIARAAILLPGLFENDKNDK